MVIWDIGQLLAGEHPIVDGLAVVREVIWEQVDKLHRVIPGVWVVKGLRANVRRHALSISIMLAILLLLLREEWASKHLLP